MALNLPPIEESRGLRLPPDEEETTLGGLAESAGAGIAAGFTAPPRFAGAGLEVIEDLIGVNLGGRTITDISKNAQEWWQRRIGKSKAEQLIGNAGETLGTIGSSAALLAAGGLVAAGGVGATAATQAAIVKGAVGKGLLSTLAGGAGLEKTVEARREGAPKLNAYGAGVLTAATEYLTEKIPLGQLGKIGNKFFQRLVTGAIADVGGEMAATAVELSVTDKLILGKDHHLTEEQYMDILKDTAAVAILSTIGLSAGAKVVDNVLIDGLNKIKPPRTPDPHISVEKEEAGQLSKEARSDAKSQYPELEKQRNTAIPDGLEVTEDEPDVIDVGEEDTTDQRTAWEKTHDKSVARSKEVRQTTFGKIWRSAVKGLVDVSGNLQAKLIALGPAGQEVVWRQNAIAGASTKAANDFDIDSKPIYDGLNPRQRKMFDMYKGALRALEIRRNKGAGFTLQDGHTEQSIADFMQTIPDHLINDPSHPEGKGQFVIRNDAYKAAMDKMIQLSIDSGLTTEEDAARLRRTGKEYVARDILDYIDPIVQRRGKGGKTITVRDSGIQSLSDEGSERLIETDTRLLMEQIYQRTWTRAYKNQAGLELLSLTSTEPALEDMGIYEAEVVGETKRIYEVQNRETGKISKIEAKDLKEAMKITNDTIDGPATEALAKTGRERTTAGQRNTYTSIRGNLPIFEPINEATQMKASVMEDGERREVVMPLELGSEWITGDPLLPATLSSIIGWVSGKKVLQSMATTLNDEFAITNIPRDLAHIWLTTEEYSSFAPIAAFEMAVDIAAAVKNFKSLRQQYIDNGGGMEMLSGIGKLGLKGDSALAKGFSALETTMGKAGEFSEMVTRLALMRRAMRNKKSTFQAAQIARGYLDFARGGSVAKALNSGLPFFNAAIQGTRGLFRAAKQNKKLFGAKVFQIGSMAYGLAMANMSLFGDDYDDVPDYEKDNNWIFMTNSTFIDSNGEERRHYIRIAKDQGQRAFAKIFENWARKNMGLPVDHISIIEEVSGILPIIPGEDLPPTVEMVLGYSVNKDFWIKEDIWKGPDVLPQEEYNKYTPEVYVKLGEVTGKSPVRLQYAAKQLFTRGNIWTSAVGYASKMIFDELTPEEREKISKQSLEKYPGVRRLLRSTRPDLRRKKEIEAEKVLIDTARLKVNREFDALAERFFSASTDRREVMEYIKRQETIPDRKRLLRRFKNLSRLQNVTNRGFWFDLMDLPPEQRAVNYWNKWVQLDEAGRSTLDRQSKKVPGFRSKRFNRTFIKMRKFGEQGGR
jgi:hypothetical protein